MNRLIAAIVIVSLLSPSVAAAAPAIQSSGAKAHIPIFVGPQTREGFVDVDKGVLDSIKDLKGELRGKTRFRVVETREDARLVLEVVSRGKTSTNGGGAVGMPCWHFDLLHTRWHHRDRDGAARGHIREADRLSELWRVATLRPVRCQGHRNVVGSERGDARKVGPSDIDTVPPARNAILRDPQR